MYCCNLEKKCCSTCTAPNYPVISVDPVFSFDTILLKLIDSRLFFFFSIACLMRKFSNYSWRSDPFLIFAHCTLFFINGTDNFTQLFWMQHNYFWCYFITFDAGKRMGRALRWEIFLVPVQEKVWTRNRRENLGGEYPLI